MNVAEASLVNQMKGLYALDSLFFHANNKENLVGPEYFSRINTAENKKCALPLHSTYHLK